MYTHVPFCRVLAQNDIETFMLKSTNMRSLTYMLDLISMMSPICVCVCVCHILFTYTYGSCIDTSIELT